MTTRTSRQRPHLLIIDSGKLLPTDLRDAISTHQHWSVAKEHTRRKPTIALLVIDGEDNPSTQVQRLFTTVAAIPTIVYDATPTTNRQAGAFSAGANGYVVPGITLAELAPIIDLAQRGGFGACPSAIRMMREQMRAPLEFSRREHEVVTLYALGANPQSVASELNIPLQTVEDALGRACRKAGVDSTVALVTWWTRWMMLEEPGSNFEDEPETVRYAMTA